MQNHLGPKQCRGFHLCLESPAACQCSANSLKKHLARKTKLKIIASLGQQKPLALYCLHRESDELGKTDISSRTGSSNINPLLGFSQLLHIFCLELLKNCFLSVVCHTRLLSLLPINAAALQLTAAHPLPCPVPALNLPCLKHLAPHYAPGSSVLSDRMSAR